MEKQIYGNITNTARTQFQFDKIYPNKRAMDEHCDTDGIYAGRYVLVEYDNENLDCFIQLYKRNEKFYFAEFPSIQARPGINIDYEKICYIRTDKDYLKIENNIRNIGSCEFYKTTSSGGFELIVEPKEEKINPYLYNWCIDYAKYSRGFDSTVWQKIYTDGKEKYIMIAELNTVVPQFTISADAPSMNPLAPHVSSTSTNLNYDLHIQSPWGFRIAQAKDGSLSDETTIHIEYEKDADGNLIIDENGQYIEIESEPIQADIYYNKDALKKYKYELVDFANHVPYEKDKYYYKRNNVYALDLQSYTIDTNFDKIVFYEEKKETNPKIKYYYNALELKTIDLLKSYETNWKTGTFYIMSNQEFSIVVDKEFDKDKQYYIAQSASAGNVIYTPIKLTEGQYKPNVYYEMTNVYTLDESQEYSKEKEYYQKNEDDTYTLIKFMVFKPEYEVGKYYTFKREAYILSTDDSPSLSEQYYRLPDPEKGETEYIKVFFGGNEYEPYLYYKKVEDNYVLLRDPNPPENIELYERFIQAEVNDAINQITVLPTGQSGRLYNSHIIGKEKSQEVANDIQEMSIMLPAIGNMVAEVWNLMYTKERNDLIYSNPFYDLNMYTNEGVPLYLSNLESFVGIINMLHDLIGHNIVKIDSLNSVQVDSDGKIILNNERIDYITKDTLDRYIYCMVDNEGKSDYYRLRAVDKGANQYDLTFIKMSTLEGSNPIDTIYETLIQIQAALGTNETIKTASTDSIKGALLLLKEVIEEQSKGISFMTVGESLAYEKNLAWKDIFGTPLYQDYNMNTYIKANYYAGKKEEYENYYTHKFFTPYAKTTVPSNEVSTNFNDEKYYKKLCGLKRYDIINITEENFESNKEKLYYYNEDAEGNYFQPIDKEAVYDSEQTYFIKNENKEIYALFEDYYFDNEKDENGNYLADYSVFTKKSFEEIETPLGEDYYVVVLPSYYYYVIENNENIKVTSTANIFTEVIEYYMYVIMHDNPRKSNLINNIDYNTTIELEKNVNNYSALAKIEINKKGHIYNPNKENGQKELFVLPQAIVSENEPKDVPIGTLWYDTKTNNS